MNFKKIQIGWSGFISMITLSKKLKQQQEGTNKEEIEHKRISIRDQLLIKGECGSVKDGCFTKLGTNKEGIEHKRISFRDQLLIKEVQEMEENLPKTCNVNFENPNVLHKFDLSIHPDEGYWHGGTFHFTVDVPDDYNIVPPKVHCDTRIWHPNIDEEGEVCLSLLRQNSYDMMGWAPTRRLKDVIWGLNSLFSDLLNFDDPLNVEAAEHYARDKESFKCKVQSYIELYATKR